MKKIEIAKQIIKIAKQLVGIQFATKQQMQKYLKDHPKADKSKHSVKVKKQKDKSFSSPTKMTEEQKRLDKLSEDSHYKYDVARNPNAHAKTLQKLSNDEFEYVVRLVASNPSTPAKTLQKLSSSEHRQVRYNVAQNSSTPGKALQRLSGEEDVGIRYEVAKNPNTPEHILQKLSKDKFFEKVVQDKGHVEYYQPVVYGVSANPNAPKHILQQLSKHQNDGFRSNVARNPNTPEHILQKLSKDRHYGVRADVARNPNVSRDILQKLSNDGNSWIRVEVAKNPNTSVKTLQKLSDDKDEDVRLLVASNPNTPVQTLQKLSNDENSRVIGAAIKALRNLKQSKPEEKIKKTEQLRENKSFKIDWNKMSPQLRQRLEGMSQEQIKKFLGWLSGRAKKPTSVQEQLQQQI